MGGALDFCSPRAYIPREAGPGRRNFSDPIYAQNEHIGGSGTMTTLHEHGDDRAKTARGPRFPEFPMPSLEFTDEVARETEHLYERVKDVIPAIEWPVMAP